MPSITFQQGVNGYAGTQDTTLRQSSPNTNLGSAGTLYADSDTPTGTGQDDQVLLQFSALFGSATNQIPLGATITKATLSLQTTNAGDGAALHRMLTGWSEAATWGSLSNGIQANGTEAVAAADRVTGRTAIGVTTLDVTASVQAWAGGAANNGWAFLPSGGDGWDFLSAEGATKPKLTVEYTTSTTPPPTNTAPVAADDSATTNQGTPVTITVLANDTDSNGDTLTVSAITANATHGTTTLNSNGTITYTPTANYLGDDSFTYSISDGRGGSDTATVNLTINAPTTDRPFDESYIATTFPGAASGFWNTITQLRASLLMGTGTPCCPTGPSGMLNALTATSRPQANRAAGPRPAQIISSTTIAPPTLPGTVPRKSSTFCSTGRHPRSHACSSWIMILPLVHSFRRRRLRSQGLAASWHLPTGAATRSW
ncbi:Ig-like domain-containing protein [Microvirga aerilata]|uniref:Ig-like domain-containing protein n=1 Tax=Microvirga aerilata TaxID=670292 RepID=UPI00363F445A